MSTTQYDWWTWITRQGVFAAMLIGFAVWFGQVIVVPMRDAQTKFTEAIIKSGDKNADANLQNAVTNSSNSSLITKVIDNQSLIINAQKTTADTQTKILDALKEDAVKRVEHLRLLEQIRDKK